MLINEYLAKLLEMAKGLERLDFFNGSAELSRTEFRLLQIVVAEREMKRNIISSELARRLGVTRSAVSQIVTKLEEKNIVKRTASAYDRKIAYICLSDYAASMFEQQCVQANEFMEKVVAEFGKDRLDGFLAEYDALCEVFQSVKGEEEN